MQVLALQLHLCPSAVPPVEDKAGAGMKVSTDHGGGLWPSVEHTLGSQLSNWTQVKTE